MKVSELFEAYTPPVKNTKLAFTAGGKKVGVGKQGIAIGGSKEWLKTFGATSVDIDQALRTLRQSSQYRALVGPLGLEDQSSERHNKIGSMMFVGSIEMSGGTGRPTRHRRVKFTIQPNGKIDETAQNNFHRAPVTSSKPRIVPGDAVQSIVKTMASSMEKLASTIEHRVKQAKAEIKAHAKQAKAEIKAREKLV